MKYLLKYLTLLMVFLLIITVTGCTAKENTFIKTGNNVIPRSSHTATLLPNGNVLIAGGMDYRIEVLKSMRGHLGTDTAEIYNPKTGKFSLTGNMTEKRIDPQSILLTNGKVLIVDGVTEDKRITCKIKSAELYDYKIGKFTKTGDLNYQREMGHTLTLLKDGRVLVVGGGVPKVPRQSIPCEIYDYKTGKFKVISPMHYERSFHTATLLNDGKVLILGGELGGQYGVSINEFPNAEIFDPKTEKFTKAGKPLYKRKYAAAVLLNNGKVLIIGGEGYAKKDLIETDSHSFDRNFDPKTGKYFKISNTQRHLDNAELYNPKSQKFEKVINLKTKKHQPLAVKLHNGNVLIVGDFEKNCEEIYNPLLNKFYAVNSLGYSRGNHTLTLLKNGDVLVIGGLNFHRFKIDNLLFK